jgi:uncharacterized damage-inducible protein DinB
MASEVPSRIETSFLADQLERSFYGGAWHGLALSETLDGVDAAMAAEIPDGECHSLWQTVQHVRIWLDIARRRIEGEPGASELAPEADWPVTEEVSPAAWKEAKAALEHAHRGLHGTVRGMDDAELANPVVGSDPTVRGLLTGILQHNAYHGGQMVLLRRALQARRSGR